MPDLFSLCQSSFISGRSTQYNIFVMQEILHSLCSKKKNKTGCMVMKLDLEKVYDLKGTLHAFNYLSNLIRLILFCVKNAKSQILWNGEALESVTHTCGLRQDHRTFLCFVCNGCPILSMRKWLGRNGVRSNLVEGALRSLIFSLPIN